MSGDSRASSSAADGEVKSKTPLRGLANDSGWEQLWQNGRTPWDSGTYQPALEELFEKHADLPRGRALVPGCGRGYDVAYLARQGYETTGVDNSPTAVKAARAAYARVEQVHFEEADFFEFSVPEVALTFDYTFMCSFPPDLRTKVAQRYAELVPSGQHLATLIYPIDGDREGGPPYSVSLELYRELFGRKFDLIEDWKPAKAAGTFGGSPTKVDRQHMALWKRR